MPLFLKALDPLIDILGDEQVLQYNADQVNNNANLLLLNDFTATAGIFPSTSLSFANSSNFKGFCFIHEPSTGSIYGNFSLKTYNKFGSSTNIFSYNETTDSLIFLKNFDLISNNLTTTGVINANTGTLKGNNLAAYNSGGISVMSNLGMNNYYITTLPYPINNQDAATKQFVLDNNVATARSILHGFNNATYTTNLSAGDHIKFDGVAFVRGSNISLDTTSTYTTSTGVASVGRITLAAGKTYKLVGSLNNATTTGSGDYCPSRWFNADSGDVLGLISAGAPPNSTTNRVPGAGVIAYITTSIATRVELRILVHALVSVNGTNNTIGTAWFTAEEV